MLCCSAMWIIFEQLPLTFCRVLLLRSMQIGRDSGRLQVHRHSFALTNEITSFVIKRNYGSGLKFLFALIFTALLCKARSPIVSYGACRLSVRLSVTLVDQDHIGWKSWQVIERTISPTPSLFVAQRGKFRGDQRWGGKKWRAGEQKRQYL